MATLEPINSFAFAQTEKLVSSEDSLTERWAPWPDPVQPGTPGFRYAIFGWNLVTQGWERQNGMTFTDPLEARAQAERLDRALWAKWQLGA